MKTYDRSNFSPSVIPARYNAEVRTMVRYAVGVGWKVGINSGSMRLIAPKPHNKVLSFTRQGGVDNPQSYNQIINRLGNPLLMSTGTEENADVVAKRIMTEENRAEALRIVYATGGKAKVVEYAGAIDVVPQREIPTKHIVSEQTMIARRSQGRGYPSETTSERTWSDGSIDFTCRFEGCEFTADTRGGVARHWRTHRDETEPVRQPRNTITIPPYEPAHRDGYTPRAHRIFALAEVLKALDLTAMTPEQLAEFVLNWQHEQSESGGHMAAEREEMTSDQVLNRIRSLLDNGLYLQQQDEIERLRAERSAMETSATEALADAQRAKETLQTFRELVAEVDA